MWHLSIMRRAILSRAIHAGNARSPCRQLLNQSIDRLLLGEDHLTQFFHLALKMGVADFKGDEARFHGAFFSRIFVRPLPFVLSGFASRRSDLTGWRALPTLLAQ